MMMTTFTLKKRVRMMMEMESDVYVLSAAGEAAVEMEVAEKEEKNTQ